MKRYIFGIITLLINASFAFSQNNCDCSNRYQSEIFSNVNVQTVTYSDPHNLQMDIYTPQGDNCSNRPLIIFAHGGTFIFGTKSNSSMVTLCETFAKRGYVTASINYKLAGDIVGFLQSFTYYTDTESAYEVVLNAVSDGKAAVRYFRKDVAENGNTFGIDQNQIWAGGNSAGGVLFLHVGHVQTSEEFTDPLDPMRADIANDILNSVGGIEGNSGNEGYSSSLSGVISLGGALHRSEYVDNLDIPSVFCHGDSDGVVPYDCNGFQNNSNYDQLCGGGALSPVFESYGIDTDLLTFAGDGHCPWDASSSKMNQVISFVSDFVFDHLDCNTVFIDENKIAKELLYKSDVLGRSLQSNAKGLIFEVYKDGTIQKKMILK